MRSLSRPLAGVVALLFIAGARAAEPGAAPEADPALASTHLKAGEEALLAGDRQKAAALFRRGASIMGANSATLSGAQAQSLKEAAREIALLARDVSEGRVLSAAEADRVITRHAAVIDLRSASRSWDSPTRDYKRTAPSRPAGTAY